MHTFPERKYSAPLFYGDWQLTSISKPNPRRTGRPRRSKNGGCPLLPRVVPRLRMRLRLLHVVRGPRPTEPAGLLHGLHPGVRAVFMAYRSRANGCAGSRSVVPGTYEKEQL
jgi:hypothetical protein